MLFIYLFIECIYLNKKSLSKRSMCHMVLLRTTQYNTMVFDKLNPNAF
jgi:hypothetical protein